MILTTGRLGHDLHRIGPTFALSALRRILPEEAEPHQLRWRWFWPILAVALLARMLVAVTSVPAHPDETFQYLEQAHRLVYGYGVIPWEYVYGVRSWLIPLAVAVTLRAGESVGLDQPWEYVPLVEFVFCLLSLSLPVAMYRFAQGVTSERGSRLAFLFGCFWLHFLYFAHKPMPGILATYALLWMCVLMLRPPSGRRLFLIGIMSGLALVLRFQLMPVVGLLNLFVLVRAGWRYGPVLGGNLVMIALAGLVDLWSWGSFLFSYVENFRLNLLEDVSATFGSASPLYYTVWLVRETWALVILACLGFVALWRSLWPFALAVLVGLASFHVPSHKEFRFVIWVLPFFFITLAAALASLQARLRARPVLWRVAVTGVAVWALLPTLTGLDRMTGRPGSSEARFSDGEAVFMALARDNTLTGIEMLTPNLPWWETAGYYALGQPVPVYFWGWHDGASEAERLARLSHVSHVVIGPGTVPPDGYDLSRVIGQFSIWTAAVRRVPASFATYDPRAPMPGRALSHTPPNPDLRVTPPLPD